MGFGSLAARAPHFLGDSVQSLIVKAVSGGLAVKVVSMAIAFATQLVLANALGTSEYGEYLLVLGWLSLLLPIATLGTGESVVRLVGEYAEHEEHKLMNGVITLANIICVLSATLIAVLTVLTVRLSVSNGWVSEDLEMVFSIGAALLPFMALSAPRKGALRALLRAWQSLIPDGIVKPAIIALSMGIWLWVFGGRGTSEGAMIVNICATGIAFLFGTYLLHRALPVRSKGAGREMHTREWLSVSVPFTLLAWLYVALSQADIVMLGMYVSTSEIGTFSAAHKLATLAMFGSSAVWAIAAPMVARANKASDKARLRKVAVVSVRVNFLLTLGAACVLILFGSQLLSMFGSDFREAEPVLRIFTVGYPISAAIGGGMVGFLLTMTGRQIYATYIVAGAASLNVLLNAFLIPSYGAAGAAVATVIVLFLMNLTKLMVAARALGINPTIVGRMA